MAVMQTSVSGMKAQANRLSTVADNIANASTNGYKRATTEFSSLILPSGKSSYNSGGVETAVRYAISQEGSLLPTTSSTDLAIKGKGFFVVADGTDASSKKVLTRAGSFVPDSDGYLYNTAGYYLQGYPLTNGVDSGVVLNSLDGMGPINIKSLNMQATPSTEGTFKANLDGRDSVALVTPANLPSANAVTATYSAKSSMVVYDNLGGAVTLDIYFSKTGPSTWEMAVFNRANATPGANPFPYGAAAGPSPLAAPTTLTFNGTGQLTAPAAGSINFNIPGGQNFTFDIKGLTQLKTDYTPLEPTANGNAPSAVDKVEIGDDGIVSFTMKNGATLAAYRIALADVPSPDLLTPLAGNVYSPNLESGAVNVGYPGAGSFGMVRSSALEQSTVDLAEELATMIEAQRNYTANSKVFQTGADVLEVAVNLKR